MAEKKFEGCVYGGDGFCTNTNSCLAQNLLDNSEDLGDNQEATERREAIVNEARNSGCTENLQIPFAK